MSSAVSVPVAGNGIAHGTGGRWKWALGVFGICFAVYLTAFLLVPRLAGTTTADGDEPSYLLMTQSLIEDGDIYLDDNSRPSFYSRYYEREITFWPWVKGAGGRLVSTHPPFLSLLILPGFRLFGFKGAAVTVILLFSIASAFTFAVADRFVSRRTAFLVTLFLFLTYPLLLYSRKIYPDSGAIFPLAMGIWSSWMLKESGRPRYAAVAGLSAGMVCLFHPKYFGISLSLMLLFFLVARTDRIRLLAWWLVPAAGCLLLLFFLVYLAFGTNIAGGLTSTAGASLSQGYAGTTAGWGIPGLFLDRSSGLFVFAPFYMLFPIGLSLQGSRREWTRWWLFFPICIGAQIVVAGAFRSWNGGAAMAPRYVIPLAPVLVISVALFVDRCRYVPAYVASFLLGALQVLVTASSFAFLMGTYAMYNHGNTFLRHFLDHTWIRKLIVSIFPDLSPGTAGSVALIAAWIALYAVAIYFARRLYLRRGGLVPSPIEESERAVRPPDATEELAHE